MQTVVILLQDTSMAEKYPHPLGQSLSAVKLLRGLLYVFYIYIIGLKNGN
jgi:hypothetical protein